MRYRVKDYSIEVSGNLVYVQITIPDGVTPTQGATTKPLREAIRLIVDETAGIVFCSSMQKANIYAVGPGEADREWYIAFQIPSGKTVLATDQFTIEMDWGDEPTGLSGGDDAHNLAAFFNLPQSLPSGYHEMSDTEVLEIADEVWEAMYGFVAVPNTVHTVDASESERVFTTYMNPTKTYADYGWPALWDAQGVTIPLTDHPTANRVIYTFNPSND